MKLNLVQFKRNIFLLNLFSCLHMTSEVKDIIHTKQYDTLQYAVKLQSLELGLVEHY
jgi:hypothetical protein